LANQSTLLAVAVVMQWSPNRECYGDLNDQSVARPWQRLTRPIATSCRKTSIHVQMPLVPWNPSGSLHHIQGWIQRRLW
jgi:hypothetical protein